MGRRRARREEEAAEQDVKRDWYGLTCLALVAAVSVLMVVGTCAGWWALRW